MTWACLLAVFVLEATTLHAQATRTWVSGVGDDANPCSRTAPCKTFAGAISKTAAGGEIDALDPSGFGAVTITKAITIDGGGQVASVLVAGTNGIVVQAGAGNVVILRNLRINGISGSGSGGLNGIRFLSGRDLNVENCYIFGFTQNGIDISLNQNTQASVHILNTIVKNIGGVGIRATNAQNPRVQVDVDRSDVILTNLGIESAQHSWIVITRSVVQHAATDGIKADDPVTSDAQVNVSNTDVSYNTNGITVGPGCSGNASFNNIAYNSSCGMNNQGGGGASFFSYGSNRQIGTGSCGTITTVAQQ